MKVTSERVYDLLLEKGPMHLTDIARVFRRRGSKRSDPVFRAVSQAVAELHQQNRVVPTILRYDRIIWNAL